MPDRVHQATERLSEADLPGLLLDPPELPKELGVMAVEGGGYLDNDELIASLFPELSPRTLRYELGRLNGYVRQFAAVEAEKRPESAIIAAGATSHLYESPDNVARWVTEVFPGRFESKVGQSLAGRTLHRCDRFRPQGLADLAQGMQILGEASEELTTQVIIDFRVGRVLGVVFVHAAGDVDCRELAEQLAKAQEAKIVRMSFDR